MMADVLPFITTALAVSSAVMPILFGFVLWKFSQVFVTKDYFDEFRDQTYEDRKEIKERLTHIERLLTEAKRNR